MTSMAGCDAEECDPVKLAKDIQADDVGIEFLDGFEIFDAQDDFTDSFDLRIHDTDLERRSMVSVTT